MHKGMTIRPLAWPHMSRKDRRRIIVAFLTDLVSILASWLIFLTCSIITMSFINRFLSDALRFQCACSFQNHWDELQDKAQKYYQCRWTLVPRMVWHVSSNVVGFPETFNEDRWNAYRMDIEMYSASRELIFTILWRLKSQRMGTPKHLIRVAVDELRICWHIS